MWVEVGDNRSGSLWPGGLRPCPSFAQLDQHRSDRPNEGNYSRILIGRDEETLRIGCQIQGISRRLWLPRSVPAVPASLIGREVELMHSSREPHDFHDHGDAVGCFDKWPEPRDLLPLFAGQEFRAQIGNLRAVADRETLEEVGRIYAECGRNFD